MPLSGAVPRGIDRTCAVSPRPVATSSGSGRSGRSGPGGSRSPWASRSRRPRRPPLPSRRTPTRSSMPGRAGSGRRTGPPPAARIAGACSGSAPRSSRRPATACSGWSGAPAPSEPAGGSGVLARARRRSGAVHTRVPRSDRSARDDPGPGAPFPTNEHSELKRLLLRKSRCHVYIEIDEPKQMIQILHVWDDRRERPPKL